MRHVPVMKKPGSVPPVRIILNLEPLNAISIQDAAMITNVNDFAESFVGYSMYGLADLFSGFDAIWIHPKSRPMQVFHSPVGPKQQATMAHGYTNAMQQFSLRTAHALKPIMPEIANPFVDDCGVKGPPTRYDNVSIPQNVNIRRFVWEYAQNLDDFLGTLIMAGITASGAKTTLAAFDLHIVGSVVSYEGWKISPSLVQCILDWPIPASVTEVRSFLGIAGGSRKWIKGFSIIVKPLTELTRIVTVVFKITEEAIHTQEVIKRLVTTAPILLCLDYKAVKLITPCPRASDEGLMIVGVDSSWKGASWVIYQMSKSEKCPTLYGSCTFSATEQNYGQPKSEVYGVFRAFKELCHRIWGVHFRLDHDALSLAKIIREPDDIPNAPLLHWVAWIRLFDFEPHHVRAEAFKMEDALSRRPPAPTDTNYDDQDPEEFLDAYLDLTYSGTHNVPPCATATSTVKFLLDSVYARLSSPFLCSYSSPNSVLPIYRLTSAFSDVPKFDPALHIGEHLDPSQPNSYLAYSSLQYT
jgi:hypothetical protein